jgi:hypothetical protein
MIVPILGQGQLDVAGEHLDELNLLDTQLQSAGGVVAAALRARA